MMEVDEGRVGWRRVGGLGLGTMVGRRVGGEDGDV